jgi:tetratricopeptide (TPR) repeat protein
MASQMLARIGEFRKAEQVAEDCLAIAERCEDPILLADSYNRVAVSNLLSDTPRARRLFEKAIALVVPLGDSLRHARFLNNVGILDLMESRWSAARDTFTTAVEFSRTTGLTEQWGRAALNLGVLAIRTADFSVAPMWLSEALRLSAEAQNSEIQLIATYNLANLARDTGDLLRARNTYELAKELAERIGQTEILAGALAGAALCELDLGRVDEARTIHQILESQLATLTDWFQGRELVEALTIRLALLNGRDEAAHVFTRAVRLADTRDAYGAVLLTAEFGEALREPASEVVRYAVERYSSRPVVAENPRVRDRFGVLMRYTSESC